MSVPTGRTRLVEGLIFTTILIDFVGFSILIPVLPLYARDLGASAVEVGLLLSLYSITLVLFLPVWGWVSDRVGRRPVILSCLLGTAGYLALLAVSVDVEGIYVARALGGVFGASIGVAQAYMVDITSHEERARGIGRIGAALGVGFVVGPALGGLLHGVHPSAPFLFTAALALINFAMAAILLPEPPRHDRPRAEWRGLVRTLVPTPVQVFVGAHDSRTRLYLYLFFHIFASFSALEAMFPLYAAQELEWSPLDIGLFLAYIGLLLGVTQGILIGPVARLYGEVPLVVVGLLLTGAAMALIPGAEGLRGLLALGAAIAVGNGLAFPSFTSLFSKVCGTNEAGEFLGHSQSMAQTGRALGPYWGGWAMQTVSVGAPFLVGGLAILVGLSLFLARLNVLVPGASGSTGEAL